MKILHLSNAAGKLGGGVSEVVNSLMNYQSKILNPYLWFMGEKNIINEIHGDIGIDKKRLYAMPSFFGITSIVSPIIFFKKKYVNENFKIIHQHGIFLPISIFNLCINSKVKKVISTHGYLEKNKLQISKIKKKIVLSLYEKQNLKSCDCFIACSEQEAVSLREFGLKQPIVLLPNGIHKEFLYKKDKIDYKDSFKKKFEINVSSKILLFLSRVHPWKGLKLLLKCIFEIKSDFRSKKWILVIGGPDELDHTNELKKLVKSYEINDLIKFVGPLYGEDKINAIDSSHCSILPSKGENFGISIIESLARSVPVITTKNTPWSSLKKNNCGWHVKRNKKHMNDVLIDLINTPSSLLFKKGLNGHDLVKKKYLWSTISYNYIKVYKWILNDFDRKFKNDINLF